MTGILRSWRCLNPRCAGIFDAWEANPVCPSCGNVRVSWVPRGGNVITEAARTADTELRKLADGFGLSNINSARRDERAKPKLDQPSADRNAPSMNFAPGFSAPVSPNGGAMCVPSTSRVNFKTRVGTGVALPHSRSVPGVHTGTRIEASHRPPR